ncbi:MAG: site-2 protease family protein [Deltaproteobacteria bacterium]|nr:MAG: site-2 protease family protein [Deltaproteobacteria bacterium]
MPTEILLLIVLAVAAMVLSGAVHEWAHAFTAWKLGDDTAARQGRLTLNPTSHVDPVGTLLFPAIGAAIGGFLFGWARPVPFSPIRFNRNVTMRQGTLLVAAAGPLSNVVLAALCCALLRIISLAGGGSSVWDNPTVGAFGMLLAAMIWLNVVLALFNLLPVPPLDGDKVLRSIVGERNAFVRFTEQYQLACLLLVFFIGIRLLAGPVMALMGLLLDLFGARADFAAVWPL